MLLSLAKKHWRGCLLCFLTLCVLCTGWLVLLAGDEISSPPRRSLLEYHLEFFKQATEHGYRIDLFTASDGTPCLVCSPSLSANFGKRGKLIRKQLASRGRTLPVAGKIVGNLVLLHGRKGRKEDYLPIAERLCAVGFRCIIPDLPAHGDHPGKIATYGVMEADLPARVLKESANHFAFAPQPVGLLGMSMGGSVAVHSATRTNAPWKVLTIISSFDSFPSVIENQTSRYIGTTLGHYGAKAAGNIYEQKSGIALADIQPARLARFLRIPTLVAHGSTDSVICISSGKRLYDALPLNTRKRWREIPSANHDNVLITDYPIYADIAEWMLENL